MVLYAVGRISQSSKTDSSIFPLLSRARPITIKVRSEGAGVKDAGGTGAVAARLALGRGEQASSYRDPPTPKAMAGEAGTTGPGHKALLYLVNRAAGWLGGVGGRRRGPRCPRAPAPAGYGTGAARNITALVAGAGSILHDRPGTKPSVISRAGSVGRGRLRGFLASGLAERSAGASTRAAGAASRPTRSGASPEARLTLSFISQRQSAGLSATRQRAARGCPG